MVAGFEERRRAQGTFLEISTYLMGEVDFSFCRQYCQQLCIINIDGDLLIKIGRVQETPTAALKTKLIMFVVAVLGSALGN